MADSKNLDEYRKKLEEMIKMAKKEYKPIEFIFFLEDVLSKFDKKFNT